MPNYKIKKGDTLTKIAKENGTTVSNLMKMNPQIKDKNLIITGQTIKVYNPSSNQGFSNGGMRLANEQKPKSVSAKKINTNNYSSVIEKQKSFSQKPKKTISESNPEMNKIFKNYRK